MKKAWLVIALTALGGMAVNTFADVQNIRLSGDIRVRGYYLADAATTDGDSGNQLQTESTFISQRTRVCVEADLEDHVLVVVTVQAQGLWGAQNATTGASGAGTAFDGSAINRSWDVGVNEAYVQLNELFYTPATLKVGRQYLNYGRGLIISSTEDEYNFDAGRLVLDFYPITVDIVGGRQVDDGTFGGNHAGSNGRSADLLFANVRDEINANNAKINIEGYAGWMAQSAHGGASTITAPPTDYLDIGGNGASPIIIGARGDLSAGGATAWLEAAYECGPSGSATPTGISAYILNAGAKFAMKDTKMSPTFNANWTYASGGGNSGRHDFVPWFDYTEGYNGFLFAPYLSNIQIFNLGASVKPAENFSLGLQGYYYLKADGDSFAGSNPNIDFGGLGFTREAGQSANSKNLGFELDTIAGYDYSKDVRLQLVYGFFVPGNVYNSSPLVSSVAHEVRAEVDVKF